ncbi:asparaginase domain-containing protein [Anaerolineales bacterium HSG6]|nr:asparaginase domain-containing protein [Anaerolineales bacterium HSG6]MDM8532147.1 asparaginase domain-containing protein [Anaerolineales bacterium HSG25]
MPIKIFITGGTIGKQYNQLNGELVVVEDHLTEMLVQAKCTVDLDVETIMLKDSLDMTEVDRETIRQYCVDSSHRHIVVTHGTDTMVETAKLLGESITDKTIVFVGSMIPYKFGGSDALFNLGTAISAVQILPVGVYVTMNGKIFNCDNVRKNKVLGQFERLR